jgi:hypothetical protein
VLRYGPYAYQLIVEWDSASTVHVGRQRLRRPKCNSAATSGALEGEGERFEVLGCCVLGIAPGSGRAPASARLFRR